MKSKIIVFSIIITVLFAYHAVATGYVAGTASHTTLYSDTIRGKAGSTVTLDDTLSITGATTATGQITANGGVNANQQVKATVPAGTALYAEGATAVEGHYSSNLATYAQLGVNGYGAIAFNSNGHRASLASNTYGLSGQHSNGNLGILGDATSGVLGSGSTYGVSGSSASTGVYGLNSGNSNYGYLAGTYGAYGYNGGGNFGYLGGASYGARGENSNGNYGYLGSTLYGVYGSGTTYGIRGECNACTYGLYTGDKAYAAGGIDVGGAGTCADSSATAACALNDIAEDVYSKDNLEEGDVVVIDTEYNEHFRLSKKAYDPLVGGIVSLNPAFHIKTSGTGIPLALAGRVKAKASAENGPIKRGDLLTTSSTAGHLMRCNAKEKCIGSIVGKALEPLANGKGKILVLVALG